MIGKSAPDFEAVAVLAGSEIGTLRLAEYRGQWVLLFFYPASFTFNCASEVTAYADRQPEFSALSCALIGASCDSAETHLTWNAQARLEGGLGNTTLNLIGDHDKSISERYGVLAADKSSQRTSFLIGPDGLIRHVISNEVPAEENVEECLRVLRSLQQLPSTTVSRPVSSSSVLSAVQGTASSAMSSVVSAATSLLVAYQRQLTKEPLITKALTSAIVSALGEVIGSWLRGQKQTALAAWRRVSVFFLYGLCISGPFFHWWYGTLDRSVRSLGLPKIWSTLLQVAVQQLVVTPPFLLVTMAFLQLARTTKVSEISKGVKSAFAAALFTNWRVWSVAQTINFQLVPLDYRVLYGNILALWWNIYLSLSVTSS